MKTENILLELIDISCGCQQRVLDAEMVEHYKSLLDDGVTLPPIDVVYDGKMYYPWDGFHRIKCAQDRKEKSIKANVQLGDENKAQWLSFSANSTHGIPRSQKTIRFILEKIFKDKRWAHIQPAKVAKHVGCCRSWATRIREEVLAQPAAEESKPAEEKPKAKATKAPKTEPDAPLKDETGAVIPQNLSERYVTRRVVVERVRELDAITNAVQNAIAGGDLTFSLMDAQKFFIEAKNVRNRLKSAIAHAVCVYCKGKGCGACHNFGFLNKSTWKAAPK